VNNLITFLDMVSMVTWKNCPGRTRVCSYRRWTVSATRWGFLTCVC